MTHCRSVCLPAVLVALLSTVLAGACAGRSAGWTELNPPAAAGEPVTIAGTVQYLDLEGGLYVIRDGQGAAFQPTNLPPELSVNGLTIAAEARRRKDLMSIGMAGELVDLLRVRSGERRTVSGTIAYRERMALPADAVIEVTLADVSRADAPAVPVSQMTMTAGGRQVPIPFALAYAPAAIDERASYAVRATIRQDGTLMFTSTTRYGVITQGQPTKVVMLLERVSSTAGTAPGPTPAPAAALPGTSWLLEDIGGAGVVDRIQATLLFGNDGTVTGNASCNQFRGPAKLSDTSLVLGPLVSTRKGCVDAVNAQETRYLDALSKVTRFERKGTLLYLYGDGTAPVLRFSAGGTK